MDGGISMYKKQNLNENYKRINRMQKIVKRTNKLVQGFDANFIEIWNQNLEIKIKKDIKKNFKQ